MSKAISKRLTKKFKEIPKWAEDFSVEMQKDANISRRDFIRFLSLVSLGLFTGTAGVFLRTLFNGNKIAAPILEQKILDTQDIAVGESYVFQIPNTKEPAILVRLGENNFVAYSQKCTHLQCPVLWKKEEAKLACPCHKGAFSVETGQVLYGPPERPLPKIEIEQRKDGIYFVGMKRGAV